MFITPFYCCTPEISSSNVNIPRHHRPSTIAKYSLLLFPAQSDCIRTQPGGKLTSNFKLNLILNLKLESNSALLLHVLFLT